MASHRTGVREKAGRVCLVTGASSGIGLATALELLRAGHIVYGAARRVPRMAPIVAAGGYTLPLDVTEEDDLQRVVSTVMDRHGRIDVLVNNAGTVVHGAAEDTPVAMARDLFEVNVLAPARLAQLVLPGMRLRGSGTIVNVSSIGGVIALPLGAWYYASKHALEAFSDTLRMEVEQFGVDVVVIRPGIIRTGFEAGAARQLREVSGHGAYGRMAEAMARAAEAQTDAETQTDAQAQTDAETPADAEMQMDAQADAETQTDADGPASRATDPLVVAEVIRRAVEADRPETRYVVGWQAEALLNLRESLTDRDFDARVTAPLL
ncbi:SDR family NAD(P)-dependent oxidoreductase [Nonomuraea fuscirosea]|uniref:SDR family NAD(P)-dependent oxidoreductase n=1 Tax=Nonomuraea fuscirosea TaxID=1291556 RepID=UPI002DDBFB45|nr:SDR family NAD(P)-dependent oxidoreductase [Nonomuraea fuscirosea]WSA56561.1 SDR family NAD(P)-dependent oxidoreductase [Nonomuraea fuscirosea]